jgi:hypothetical protein
MFHVKHVLMRKAVFYVPRIQIVNFLKIAINSVHVKTFIMSIVREVLFVKVKSDKKVICILECDYTCQQC